MNLEFHEFHTKILTSFENHLSAFCEVLVTEKKVSEYEIVLISGPQMRI